MDKTLIGKNFYDVQELLPNNGRATTKTIFKKKILIGYVDGNTVFLDCELKEIDLSTEVIFDGKENKILNIDNFKDTINHEKINKYTVLSISGTSKYFSGQIVDSIKGLESKNYQLKEICDIWRNWHLNDMQPNCIHQTSFNCNEYFEKRAKIETKKCPKNYHYGSKWLIKELPKEIENKIIQLFTEFKR